MWPPRTVSAVERLISGGSAMTSFPSSGTVTATSADAGNCSVEVEDNGIGFDQAYGEKIFKPFKRLHHSDAFEGTGMGLALVRRIAERHSGKISAHGDPRRGAKFVVTLPACTTETVAVGTS